jgi:hypothetical protein
LEVTMSESNTLADLALSNLTRGERRAADPGEPSVTPADATPSRAAEPCRAAVGRTGGLDRVTPEAEGAGGLAPTGPFLTLRQWEAVDRVRARHPDAVLAGETVTVPAAVHGLVHLDLPVTFVGVFAPRTDLDLTHLG